MNREELKEKIAFLAADRPAGHIIIYTIDMVDDVRYLDIADELQQELYELFREKIADTFDNDNYELLDYSTADRRNGCYYIYDIEQKPRKMELMAQVIGDDGIAKFSFANDDLDFVKALIIVLSSADGQVVSLFKPLSDVEKFLKRKGFLIRESEHRFVRNDSDMIRISPSFQILYVDGNYVMLQPEKMEKMIGLDKVLINESKNESLRLQRRNLIEDMAQLTCHCDDSPNFCKLLLSSIKKSPLFAPDPKSNSDVIAYAKIVNKKFRGDGRFHFNADGKKFVIQNKLQAERFLRLINNDFLKSEFTGDMFEALAKNRL